MSLPVVQDPNSYLFQALGSLGQGLGQLGGQYYQRQKQQQHGNILENILNDLGENPTQQDYLSATSKAIAQGVSPELAKNFLTNALNQFKPSALAYSQFKPDDFSTFLQGYGYTKEEADKHARFASSLNPGAKTEYMRRLMDSLEREGKVFSPKISVSTQSESIVDKTENLFNESNPNEPVLQATQQEEIINVEPIEKGQFDVDKDIDKRVSSFNWEDPGTFEGLTEKDKVKRQDELGKENRKIYSDVNQKYRKYRKNQRLLKEMDDLNDTEELISQGGQFFNVEPQTGKLRFAQFASPKAQRYVKNVMEFIEGIKDTFGARITNFDLQAFLAKLPTLANSEQGRREIIRSLKLINDIDRMHNRATLKIYDRYKTKGIESSEVEKRVRDITEPYEEKLLNEYQKSLNTMDELTEYYKNVPRDRLVVKSPDGKIGTVLRKNATSYKKKGYQVL